MDDAFGHWLAGFIDGEGCFWIQWHSRGNCPRCGFSITLRSDDEAILREARERTGLGNLTISMAGRGRQCEAVRWAISTKAGCLALVDLLDRFPLRAKKQVDYRIWRRAVLRWAQRSGYAGQHGVDWSEMRRLSDELKLARGRRGD